MDLYGRGRFCSLVCSRSPLQSRSYQHGILVRSRRLVFLINAATYLHIGYRIWSTTASFSLKMKMPCATFWLNSLGTANPKLDPRSRTPPPSLIHRLGVIQDQSANAGREVFAWRKAIIVSSHSQSPSRLLSHTISIPSRWTRRMALRTNLNSLSTKMSSRKRRWRRRTRQRPTQEKVQRKIEHFFGSKIFESYHYALVSISSATWIEGK